VPVTVSNIIAWPMRKTLFSSSALWMWRPRPVFWRSVSAAWMAMTPNIPPMTSFTEAPTRMGRSGSPVM
jgi:hypothetical protein